MEVGLAAAGQRADHRVHYGGVQGRAGRVTRAGGVDGPVRLAEQGHDLLLVVEIDHGRCGAAGGDGIRLRIVAHERRDLVSVLSQFGQYVGSDEPCRTREYHLHNRNASCLIVTAAHPRGESARQGEARAVQCPVKLT